MTKWISKASVMRIIDASPAYMDILNEKTHMAEQVENLPVKDDGRPHREWISVEERLPEEHICDDGYVEPSDYVWVFGDHGNYGVSRYWGNRRTKKENPGSFSDWMDLNWKGQKPIAWMPLPEPPKGCEANEAN